MGREHPALAFAVIGALVFRSQPSIAQEPPEDQSKAEAAGAPSGFEVAARVGGGADTHAGFVLAGLDLGYRVVPELVLGAYGQTTLVTMPMSSDACGSDCAPRFVRFGARGELHLSPDFLIDPWAGLGAGGLVVGNDGRAEVLIEGGLDVRPAPALAVGGFVSLAPTPGGRGAFDGSTAVGLRVSLSFGRSDPPAVAGRGAAARTRF